MTNLSRRRFVKFLGAGTAASVIGMPNVARAARPRVVVIGGGAGGGTAAKYIARDSKGAIDVILIEPSKKYYTCFFSNLYLGGFRDYASIGHTYENMAAKHNVGVIHEWAEMIDRDKKKVRLSSGADIAYDRLIVSPGIDMKYDSVPGYSAEAQAVMPHAWKSGTQVQLLKAQVMAMKQGGTFVMVPPPNPFRCPPGPYERISMIAHLFKQHNPKAKIVVIDPKPKFSKQGLFQAGWESYYPGMIEWLPPAVSGGLKEVDVSTMSFKTDLDTVKADAASLVPAQTAGRIAHKSGLTDASGWCPIIPKTMQSAIDENIHVIGDASVAAAMPKSGFSANSQAKVAAMAVRGALTGSRVFDPRFANTCWSLIAPNDGVKVGASYKAGDKKIEPASTFISKTGESAQLRKETYEESVGWYEGITTDIFG
ncbi:MAG TPA: FCSD flavin-binding domain-containing protein [Hyphomicrobiaceae bacterium]|nr:FCSD flavin-binding domain-containing protein [Hyphomicrobiaceae bacterium]